MPDDAGKTPEIPSRPITDSPWFWLVLFLLGALAALVVVTPKFEYRQARLERMNETREQIALRAGGVEPEPQDADELVPATGPAPSRRLTLGPLGVTLSILLAIVAVAAGVTGHLRNGARRQAAEIAKGRQ